MKISQAFKTMWDADDYVSFFGFGILIVLNSILVVMTVISLIDFFFF